MKIKRIKIKNFAGIKGEKEIELPKICALVGVNGTGKTSFLNAIRFVISGVEPDGDIIHNGENEASVEVIFDSGNSYKRIKQMSRSVKSVCKINDKTVLKKDFDKAMEEELGIPISALENVMSADIFKTLNPKEFGKFILGYIPEKMTKERVLSYISNSTIEMMNIVDLLLPDDDISTEMLEDTCATLKDSKKDLNAQLKSYKAILETLPTSTPTTSLEELKEERKNLFVAQEKIQAYNKSVLLFNELERKQEAIKNAIKKEEEELAKIVATRPNEEKYNIIQDKKQKLSKIIESANKSIHASKMSISTLERSLLSLTSNVCPFSEKIKCSTDKSDIVKEIEESKEINEASAKQQEAIISETEKELEEVLKEEVSYNANKEAYEKLILLQKSLNSKKTMLTDLGQKPEKPNVSIDNFDIQLQRIENQIKTWEDYQKRLQLYNAISSLTHEIKNYDKLCAAFDTKGEVVQKVLDFYSEILDNAVNSIAGTVRNGLKIHFNPDNGLKVQADTGHGMISYESLSMGERTDVIYLIIDLINQLSNARILLLDETSVLDKESFRKLLTSITNNMDNYDHIILAGVNNDEVLKEFNIKSL